VVTYSCERFAVNFSNQHLQASKKGGESMKSRTNAPKKFSWKITVTPKKQIPGTIVFQEQCSSGPGGGGQCCGQCGGK
jgi:hypothetical protein